MAGQPLSVFVGSSYKLLRTCSQDKLILALAERNWQRLSGTACPRFTQMRADCGYTSKFYPEEK